MFVREGAAIPVNMNDQLCMGTQSKAGAVSNRLDRYENLCFLMFGAEGKRGFQDEMGNDISLVWTQAEDRIDGRFVCPITLFHMSGNDSGNQIGSLFGRTVRGSRKEQL